LFNFDRAFSNGQNSAVFSSTQRSLQDRQRDIYDSHRHRVFALAYYMVGNEVHAEETLTQTFVRAFDADPEPNANSVDAALMVELKERVGFEEQEPHFEARPEDSLATRNVLRTDLEEAVGELPPVERLVFLLKDVEGYSNEAVSRVMEIPEEKLPRILMSARLRLRSVLAAKNAASTPPDRLSDDSAAEPEAA
jgi:RNA polymerase sigma-70 factor, ECF subfamily